jgi:ABC-2 type transport system permease protein
LNITLIGFLKKEFRQVLRDPRMRLILFVLPVIQLTLFGVAISTEVKNIRLSLIAAPNDTVAQDVYRHAIASGWFVPAHVDTTDPFERVQSGRADAVLVAPAGGLTRAIGRGKGELQLLIDATNVTKANSVERYMQEVLTKTLVEDGLTTTTATTDTGQLRLSVRLLYNPSMRSAIFMVPGVMSMIVCVLTILLTSMALAREKEVGTFETLVAAPIHTWEIMAGKTIPYFILGLIDIPLILLVAVGVFGVPIRGPLWALGLASIAFIASTVSIGMLISTFAKNQQQAMMGGFMFLFPAILLSGIMFPVDNMPLALKVFVYSNPLTYFAALLRNIMIKGGSLSVIAVDTAALFVIGAVMLLIAARRFRHTLQ